MPYKGDKGDKNAARPPEGSLVETRCLIKGPKSAIVPFPEPRSGPKSRAGSGALLKAKSREQALCSRCILQLLSTGLVCICMCVCVCVCVCVHAYVLVSLVSIKIDILSIFKFNLLVSSMHISYFVYSYIHNRIYMCVYILLISYSMYLQRARSHHSLPHSSPIHSACIFFKLKFFFYSSFSCFGLFMSVLFLC